jgi:uncharacterized membrane protein
MSDALTAPAPQLQSIQPGKTFYRVESIDLLRGLIMIIMALDHVRDYFHAAAFTDDPLNLQTTTPILYFTRWITHFCAPLFMFLSGTSAFLVGTRKGKKALSRFLLTRGLWLVFLELTIVCLAWFFNIHFTIELLGVIWALGISMICLAGLIHLPRFWIAGIGLLMVFGHNLLDGIHVPGKSAASFGWSVLHEFSFYQFGHYNFFVAYPIIPWIGVMALGYCLGDIYKKEIDPAKRKKLLLGLGTCAIILFVLLRYINRYGDPSPWSQQKTNLFTVLSFFKVSKYPPSLFYLLITIGPGLLFLAFSEKWNSWLSEKIKVIGRVPLFYYLAHIYIIHIAAMIATNFSGHEWSDMVSLSTWVSFEPKLQGYGFSLGTVYIVWALLILILYFLCKWYDRYKFAHKEKWWLSYL